MAVKLRLMRMGKKKQPSYRVVAADARSPRDGRFIEIVGIYDPRAEPSTIRIDNDKATGWLHKGAQPTESVRRLLKISGAWDDFEAAKAAAKASRPEKPTAARASAAKTVTKAGAGTAKATKATKTTAKASKATGTSKAAGGTAKKAGTAEKAAKRTTKAAESPAAADEDAS